MSSISSINKQQLHRLINEYESLSKAYPGFDFTIAEILDRYREYLERYSSHDVFLIVKAVELAVNDFKEFMLKTGRVGKEKLEVLPFNQGVKLAAEGPFLLSRLKEQSLDSYVSVSVAIRVFSVFEVLKAAKSLDVKLVESHRNWSLEHFKTELISIIEASSLAEMTIEQPVLNSDKALLKVLEKSKETINRLKQARASAGKVGGTAKKGHKGPTYRFVEALFNEHVLDKWRKRDLASKNISAEQMRLCICNALKNGALLPDYISGVDAPEFIEDSSIFVFDSAHKKKIIKPRNMQNLLLKIKAEYLK